MCACWVHVSGRRRRWGLVGNRAGMMHDMTRLALIGYGAMGRLVEQLAPQHGFEVALRHGGAKGRSGAPLDAAQLRGIEVAIDFSVAAAVAENVERLAPLGIAMVIGTTGWFAQRAPERGAV